MKLTDYVARYRLRHDIRQKTAEQLTNVARLLTRFAGGQLAVDSLSEELVNRWLLSRREAGLSSDTVRGNRISILMLWHAAADEGLVEWPEKVCRIKRRERVIRAFTMADLRSLLKAADRMSGVYFPFKVPKCFYWRSFLMAAYDTGLRLNDLLEIRRRDIWWPGKRGTAVMSLIQTKTGYSHRVHLRAKTMREIEICMASGEPREHIWPPITRRHWYIRFKTLCGAACLAGTSKWIRRSGASYIARKYGDGAAQRYLGQRTPGLARRNYIDSNIADEREPLPPPLG